jgi:methionine biosynthesis protein MetW
MTQTQTQTLNNHRLDHAAIIDVVTAGSRVLDLGCGDGELLAKLVQKRQVVARGVELSELNVRACIGRGLSVRQGNIEEGLADYRDAAFDFVVLSQTLAFLDKPEPVVREMLRVGKHAIISFENTGFWRERWRALRGEGTGYELCSGEPRMRAITLRQFVQFAQCADSHIERTIYLDDKRIIHSLPSLRSRIAVFVLTRS